jgi:hypothetical protein
LPFGTAGLALVVRRAGFALPARAFGRAADFAAVRFVVPRLAVDAADFFAVVLFAVLFDVFFAADFVFAIRMSPGAADARQHTLPRAGASTAERGGRLALAPRRLRPYTAPLSPKGPIA